MRAPLSARAAINQALLDAGFHTAEAHQPGEGSPSLPSLFMTEPAQLKSNLFVELQSFGFN